MIHMVHNLKIGGTFVGQRWKNPHIQDPRKPFKMNQKVSKKLESECNCLEKVAKKPTER